MEYEIAHINISVHNGEDNKESAPVVNWHKDSYPFVCVLMLSDATDMKGGETGLRTGTGELMKIRGPQMVSFDYSARQPTLVFFSFFFFAKGISDEELCCG